LHFKIIKQNFPLEYHLQRLVKVFSTEIGRMCKVLFSSVRVFRRFVVRFVNLETVIKTWTVAVYVTQANTPRICYATAQI
jgi:hypothetical protein